LIPYCDEVGVCSMMETQSPCSARTIDVLGGHQGAEE
jgi:hypothetical protein